SNLCFFQIFESSESAGQLELNILGSGHLLGSQGHGLMEGFYLHSAQSFLKIQHKYDSLLFNIKMKFDGSSQAEAAEVCRKAVETLQDYVPVQVHLTTPAPAAPSDPAKPGPSTQQQQYFLGELRAVPADGVSSVHAALWRPGGTTARLPARFWFSCFRGGSREEDERADARMR
ncbi:hypothetical protein cypCar_00028365, partial [Cyprinus carpio]